MSTYPQHYSERDLLLLGYDMRKRHNYLVIAADQFGDELHLLDRYNHNRTTLCAQPVQIFDIVPQGAAFCTACYAVLYARVHA
jgi:hypothetical protein